MIVSDVISLPSEPTAQGEPTMATGPIHAVTQTAQRTCMLLSISIDPSVMTYLKLPGAPSLKADPVLSHTLLKSHRIPTVMTHKISTTT